MLSMSSFIRRNFSNIAAISSSSLLDSLGTPFSSFSFSFLRSGSFGAGSTLFFFLSSLSWSKNLGFLISFSSVLESAGYEDTDGDGILNAPEEFGGENVELDLMYDAASSFHQKTARILEDNAKEIGVELNLDPHRQCHWA